MFLSFLGSRFLCSFFCICLFLELLNASHNGSFSLLKIVIIILRLQLSSIAIQFFSVLYLGKKCVRHSVLTRLSMQLPFQVMMSMSLLQQVRMALYSCVIYEYLKVILDMIMKVTNENRYDSVEIFLVMPNISKQI